MNGETDNIKLPKKDDAAYLGSAEEPVLFLGVHKNVVEPRILGKNRVKFLCLSTFDLIP